MYEKHLAYMGAGYVTLILMAAILRTFGSFSRYKLYISQKYIIEQSRYLRPTETRRRLTFVDVNVSCCR